MNILVTGAAGFLGQYVVSEFLRNGHFVIGLDNFSKYGKVRQAADNHPRYKFIEGDVKDLLLLERLLSESDHIVSLAALVGGIEYFHKFPFDIISENEKITSSTFEAAIKSFQKNKLKKITLISSSMVYESCLNIPLTESDTQNNPPPLSSYGFQKLSAEMFSHAAFEQYGLPFTVIRPFNCTGIGELSITRKSDLNDEEKKQVSSHVIPDLIKKIWNSSNQSIELFGDGHQVRTFTHGSDLAAGIYQSVMSDKTLLKTYNLASKESVTIESLAHQIASLIKPGVKFQIKKTQALKHDVKIRIPSIEKAEIDLNFKCQKNLQQTISEVFEWMKKHQQL